MSRSDGPSPVLRALLAVVVGALAGALVAFLVPRERRSAPPRSAVG